MSTAAERVAWLSRGLERRRRASRQPVRRWPVVRALNPAPARSGAPSPFKQGHAAGYEEGHVDGYQQGYQAGYAAGQQTSTGDG